MRVIGCGTSWNLFFPLIMPLFSFLRYYIGVIISEYDDGINPNHKMKHHPIFLSFCTIFGDLLAGSLYIFAYFRNKYTDSVHSNSKHLTHKQSIHVVDRVLTRDSYFTRTGRFILLIFIVSFLEVTMISGFFILSFYTNPLFSFTMTITLIILEAFISAPILKYKIYTHQILSLIVIFIGFILVSIPQIQTSINSTNPKDSLLFYPIYFCFYIIFACLDVIQKWVMENKFYTPYKLVLIQGSFSMGLFAILFLVLPFTQCQWQFCNYDSTQVIMIEPLISTFKLLFSTNVVTRALMFITYELISALYVVLLLVTIYYFTPTQRSVSDSLAAFINWIILATKKDTEVRFSVTPWIGYLLVVISCLIYNEIIIIYLCKIDYYTKKQINRRAKLDSSNANINPDLISSISDSIID